MYIIMYKGVSECECVCYLKIDTAMGKDWSAQYQDNVTEWDIGS